MSFESIPLSSWAQDRKYFDFEGQKITYWTAGTGKPLLLIHGYPTAAWDWSFMWTELAKTRRVIACDMLGLDIPINRNPDTRYISKQIFKPLCLNIAT